MRTLKKTEFKFEWFVLFLAWMIPIIFFAKYGQAYLDSDMASEMVLANQLNNEGKLLSTNWFYSTEIRILCQQLFFKIGLYLFPNHWHFARTLAHAVQLLLVIVSYLYMTSVFADKKKNFYFAAILVCPFGFWQMFHNTFGGFYLLHMVFYMLCAGLTFRIYLHKDKNLLRFIILGLLCFEQGLEGIRLIMNLYTPLVLAAVLILYFRMRDLNGEFNRKELSRELKLILVSVYGLVCSLLGYLINSHVLQKIYHFSAYTGIKWTKLTFERLLDVLSVFLRVFGYPIEDYSPNDVFLLSLPGIMSAFSLILAFIVFVFLCRSALRILTFKPEERIVALTCLCSLVVTIIIFTVTTSDYNGSYFLPILPAIVALLSIEWETEQYKLKLGRRLVAWVLAVSIIFCSISTSYAFLKYTPRAINDAEGITKAIEDYGYSQGAATFWNSNIVTELSNGAIEMWTLCDYDKLEIYPWLQKTDHVDNLPVGRGVFILENEAQYAVFFQLYPNSDLIYDNGVTKVVGVEDMPATFEGLRQLYVEQ